MSMSDNSDSAMKRPTYKSLLRTSLALVAFINIANSLQAFMEYKSISSKLYTRKTFQGLPSRLFGLWNLTLSSLRFACAIDLENKSLYHVTLLSFLVSLIHFMSEVLVYRSATLNEGVISQIAISGVLSLGMLYGYWSIFRVSNEDKKEKSRKNIVYQYPKFKKSE